jgi:hypothetical protein
MMTEKMICAEQEAFDTWMDAMIRVKKKEKEEVKAAVVELIKRYPRGDRIALIKAVEEL